MESSFKDLSFKSNLDYSYMRKYNTGIQTKQANQQWKLSKRNQKGTYRSQVN